MEVLVFVLTLLAGFYLGWWGRHKWGMYKVRKYFERIRAEIFLRDHGQWETQNSQTTMGWTQDADL